MPEIPLPDLLDHSPTYRIDVEATDASLLFAFAGSSSGGMFLDTLAAATPAASSWEPGGYVDELFVPAFVRSCFTPRRGGATRPLTAMSYVVKALALPPRDVRTVHFRRAITAELLDQAALREALGALHGDLGRFRTLMEDNAAADRLDPNRRQLAVLAAFRDVVERLATGFAGATSGLIRLHDFGQAVKASEPFRSLVDLLNYDDRLATVSFRVNIGADGRVRDLELLSVEESEDNPFVSSPLQRWKAKAELLFRGYHFSDGEVMARLLDAVYEGVRPFLVPLVQLFGDVEFYLGALGFADRAKEAELPVCIPELVPADAPRELRGLFNPLLLANGLSPVPCSITTDRHDCTLLVTGPNSGGKTRLLQAVGLAQLMAQSGLFVPAERARMALSSGLLVSLSQPNAVDQTEGRLGTELIRIRALFEQLPVGAIVILDELCSGTNPSEGEEIFELVLRMLSRLRPQAFITTHFLRFAARLERERPLDDLRFLQVVLGPQNQPTYQFEEGVAQTSLAAQAAARLGVTGDQLLALIERRTASAEAEA